MKTKSLFKLSKLICISSILLLFISCSSDDDSSSNEISLPPNIPDGAYNGTWTSTTSTGWIGRAK